MAGGKLTRIFAGLMTIGLLAVSPALAGELQVSTIDGRSFKVESLQVTSNGKLSAAGLPAELTLDDLQGVVVSGANVVAPKSPLAIDLRPQGRLLVEDLEYANEKLKFKWLDRDVTLSLEPIAAVRFDPAAKNDIFEKTFAAPTADLDTIFFVGEERKVDSLKGLVESLGKDGLAFSWENQPRKLNRDVIWGIVFAGTVRPERAAAVVKMRDGSQLFGKIRAADEQKITFELEGGVLDLLWADVVTLDCRSSRVAFLSDLKPVDEEHRPLLAQPRPWQRDKSAAGKPLRLGERAFAKGIGTHSYTRLTFDAAGKFDQLVGIVGLDPLAAGKGDCIVVVQGDGSPLFSQRVRGNDTFDLQVNVRGVKQVTLTVEAGEGLDLADFVNWCDLRFLRQPERNSKP